MKTIDNDIREGSFHRAYLLYGEETYLKQQYKEKLLKALIDVKDEMNFNTFQGKDSSVGAVIDLEETLPFFAERRVILLEDTGFFKTSNDALAEYLENVSESCCLIFVETEVDKRSRTYKQIKKTGAVSEFAPQTEDVLTRWVLQRIKREGKNITQPTMQLFLERCGTDMGTIDRELEKLLCYKLHDDVITTEDVLQITTEQLTNRIFEMVDAIALRDQKKALELYYDLLALKEPPMRILFLITRQFRLLDEIKDMTLKRRSRAEIARAAGVPEFAVRKYQSQCDRYRPEQLRAAVEDGVAYDESVKSGQISDKLAAELFIVKYSKK